MLYRILTENKKREWIEKLVSEKFNAYTIYETIGHWNGKAESTLIIEIDSLDDVADIQVRRLATDIKFTNGQEAILIQRIESRSSLV